MSHQDATGVARIKSDCEQLVDVEFWPKCGPGKATRRQREPLPAESAPSYEQLIRAIVLGATQAEGRALSGPAPFLSSGSPV